MRSLLLCSLIAVAACGSPQAGDDTDTTDTETGAAEAEGLIQNTPEGGVLDWVADIDAGLDSVPILLGSDPASAQNHVLNLYVKRQEYLEMYYGPGGRLEATAELAQAIEANEGRFHALMQALAGESPDSAEAVALTDSLDAQTSRVRAAAEAVGRELTPWTDAGS